MEYLQKSAEAERAFTAGDFARARDLYSEALEQVDEPAVRGPLLLRLAAAQDETGDYEGALASLKDVLDNDRDSSAAWNNVGVLCQRIGRLDEAAQAFEQAYRLDPENAAILISLGSVALKRSDPGNALTYLTLAAELQPAHPLVHANLALTYAVFGRLEDAENALRLAALYGFEGGDPIQQRIDQLKELRAQILAGERAGAPKSEEDGEGDASGRDVPQGDSEILLLYSLEREMAQMAEQYYRMSRGEQVAGVPADIDRRLDALREQILLLRKRLDMDSEGESDSYMGWNYMRDATP